MFDLHPLCTLFPALDGDGMSALREDIRANGQRTPITLLDGKILDGRNRHQACIDIGLEPITELFSGSDPLAFVLSVNLHRRHLTEAQRAVIAAELANMPHGGAQYRSANLQIDPNDQSEGSANLQIDAEQVSQADAAKMLNVSTRSVAEAKRIQKTDPELSDAVKQGGVSLNAAAKVADLPEQERKNAVAGGPGAIKEAAKQSEITGEAKPIKKPVGHTADRQTIDELRETIERLGEANQALDELNKDLEEENKALLQAADPEVLTLVKQARAYAVQLEQRRDGLMASEAKLMSELKKAERQIERLKKELATLKQGGGNA